LIQLLSAEILAKTEGVRVAISKRIERVKDSCIGSRKCVCTSLNQKVIPKGEADETEETGLTPVLAGHQGCEAVPITSQDVFEEEETRKKGEHLQERNHSVKPLGPLAASLASLDASEQPGAKAARDREVKNMPFDEALDVSASMGHAQELQAQDQGGLKNRPFDEAMDLSEEESSVDTNPSPRRSDMAAKKQQVATVSSEDEGDETSSEDDEGGVEESEAKETKTSSVASTAAVYNAKDMEHLNVSVEIKELFQYIQRYKPHDVELESQLKCFIPDYLPSIGQIDAFLKVPRPDGVSAELGLKVLDEPAAVQSDSTVLELQMPAISKKQHGEAEMAVESAAKAANTKLDSKAGNVAEAVNTQVEVAEETLTTLQGQLEAEAQTNEGGESVGLEALETNGEKKKKGEKSPLQWA
jgi:hypothetical protein